MKVHESTMIVENDHDHFELFFLHSWIHTWNLIVLHQGLKFWQKFTTVGAQIPLKFSRFWGSAHWLAGSARFFLQASRRFPRRKAFLGRKKMAEICCEVVEEISPQKIPAWLPHAPPWNHQLKEDWALQLSANIWLQEISIFRDLSGLFGSLTCIVNHQTLPGSIVSLKAADKIFHCLSRQSRLTLDLEWFLMVSIHVPLMAHVFRVAVCVWQCVWNLRLAIQRSDHALRTGRRRILSIARCW